MIWNTIKRINSIIWNEFKNNKILFILPMILSVVSYLFDVYNRYAQGKKYLGFLRGVYENAETSSELIKEIAERALMQSGTYLSIGFCDWYRFHSFVFILAIGIIIIFMPFILIKVKYQIKGMLFFKIYAWIVWIPVGFGSILLFINGFFFDSPKDEMGFRFIYALSQSIIIISSLGILSVILIISVLQVYYYSKLSDNCNKNKKENNVFIDLISKNIFKLFIWNSLFTFLMLLLSSISLIEQIQIMFKTILISGATIRKLYPYQTYLGLLIIPWIILVPFQIISNSSSLMGSIIQGICTVKRDARQYFSIFGIILLTVFCTVFIVDLLIVRFSMNYLSIFFYIIEIIFVTYYMIGLFIIYFRKYVCNEEIIVP